MHLIFSGTVIRHQVQIASWGSTAKDNSLVTCKFGDDDDDKIVVKSAGTAGAEDVESMIAARQYRSRSKKHATHTYGY